MPEGTSGAAALAPVPRDRPVAALLLVMLLLLLLPLVAVSLVAVRLGERLLLPELDAKATSVARAAADRIELALGHGIPLDRLVGMEEFLGELGADAGSIAFVAIADPGGRVLYASGQPRERLAALLAARPASTGTGPRSAAATTTPGPAPGLDLGPGPGLLDGLIDALLPQDEGGLGATRPADHALGPFLDAAWPVRQGGAEIATVHVGVPSSFFHEELHDLLLDVVIVGLVAILIAFELLLLVVTLGFSGPLAVARRLLAEAAAGRFTRLGRVGREDEIGRLVQALNAVTLRFNAGHRTLAAEAAVLTRRGGAVAAAAAAILARLAASATFPPPGAEPMIERPSALIVVRPLAFLFVAAEELTRPFLPVLVGDAARPLASGGGLALLTGLPIAAFMLMAALTMLAGGVWSDRVGRRTSFATGALLATVGLLGTALAPFYGALLAARLVAGIGYGLAFVACQGYVIDRTTAADRSQGVATFVGGIMAADICGPAIGGILADRIGFAATVACGAALALAAAGLAFVLIDRGEDLPPATPRPAILPACGTVLRHWRFDAVILLAAMPAKLLLTGFLFYLAPLLLTELGTSQSGIGRIVMSYGAAAFLLGPLFAHLADRFSLHGLMVCVGGIVAGTAMLPILFAATPERVLLAVLGLGLGQAMSIASLLAVVTLVAARPLARLGQAPVLGAFRLLERLGGAAGPFVAAAAVASFGLAGAMAALGALSVLSAVLFGTLFLIAGYEPEPALLALDPADPGLLDAGLGVGLDAGTAA